jgi:hypothetical protein
MKIAIPTNDGIILSANARNPKGYLVLTIEGGEILNEELRWNKPGNILSAENGTPNNLMDCSLIIVNPNSDDSNELTMSKRIGLITSKEVIITKIIMEFLNTTLLRESNTCCSP